MGKKQGTQTQDKSPWGPAQPSLKFGLDELNRIYGMQNPGMPVPGSLTAPIAAPSSPQGRWVQTDRSGPRWEPGGSVGGGFFGRNIRNMFQPPPMQTFASAGGGANASPGIQEYGLLDPAAAELMATIKGERLFQNPNLDEVIRRASADVNSQFSGMGRYGSGSHQDQLFSRAAAPIRYADYSRERANQLAAVGQAPGFEMAPYQLYSARQAAPYEGISNYLGLVNQVAGQGGTQSQPIYKNPLAGALGGAAAGAGLGSMMAAPGAAGLAAVGGWPFLLGGALLGGLLS